jgi:hypothetical protein
MTGDGKRGPVEDATRHGLFRRLRRATSRRPPVPSPNSSLVDLARRPEGRLGAETWVRHEPDDRLRVEDILEPVWVIELELDNQD